MIQNVEKLYAPNMARFICSRVNLNELGAYFLAPVTQNPGIQYTVGSIQVFGDSAWVNARVTPIVSNLDPQNGVWYAVHPAGTPLAPATAPLSTVSPGLALDYPFFGFYVSTAEGSAAMANVVVVLQP